MQPPSLRRICSGSILALFFLTAAPAAALPITWSSVGPERGAIRERLPVTISAREVPGHASSDDRFVRELLPVRHNVDRDDRLKPIFVAEVVRTPPPPPAVTIPEPATLMLAGIGAVASLWRSAARRPQA